MTDASGVATGSTSALTSAPTSAATPARHDPATGTGPEPAPAMTRAPTLDATRATLFPGDSEMARRCRALDWAATPLGPPERWPGALRTAVAFGLTSGLPTCIYAGPELVLVYNDHWRPWLGPAKHPGALGRPAREVWGEIWDQLAPE